MTPEKWKFIANLKNVKIQGEITEWVLRPGNDISGKKICDICSGWLRNKRNTYLTLRVDDIFDVGDNKVVETDRGYYKLVGPSPKQPEQVLEELEEMLKS